MTGDEGTKVLTDAFGLPPMAPSEGYTWSPEIQRKAIAIVVNDKRIFQQLGNKVFTSKYITHAPLKPIAQIVFESPNGDIPSPELLRELVKDRVRTMKPAMSEAVLKEVELVLTANLSDARMIKAKAAEWARVEALIQAMEFTEKIVASKALYNGGGEEILRRFQEALAVGQGAEDRLDILGDPERLFEELSAKPRKVPTGLPQVDLAMEGGADIGLNIIAGDPKLGKTAFLTQVAVGGARNGKNVWFISGEMPIYSMSRRFASAMTGRSRAEIQADPRRTTRITQAFKQTKGSIIIDYAPGFGVNWMVSQLRSLEAHGQRIDVIIADYIDLMESDIQLNDPRHNQARICRELQALGNAAGVAIWSAKAVNRAAVSKKIVTKADLAECFAVAYIAMNILALCATVDERRNVKVVAGKSVKAPIVRIFYAAGRETQDEFTIAAYERDNNRQKWRYLPDHTPDRQTENAAILAEEKKLEQ